MKRSLARVLCLLIGILARAQDAPKPAALAGTVVKEPGDLPLKKVLLNLISEDQKNGGNYTTDSDADGRFYFENVQPGRYRLLLEKTGFRQINARGCRAEGSAITVQAGQEITDFLFGMLPTAVVTGKVVDEDGEPLSAYSVSLLRKRPGKSRGPEIASEEHTNDLGEYRFSGLFPGQYFVAVIPPPDLRNVIHSARDRSEISSQPDFSYLTTYYPGTPDFTQANAIDVRAGDEMPVNFTMIPARTFRVRGIVTGVPANQKPIVQLISRGITNSMNGADVASDGQFEMRSVAPGSYTIAVFSGSEGQFITAREPISIVAADVEGLKLLPARPFTVSGHIRSDGAIPKSFTVYTVSLRPDPDDVQAVSFGLDGWSAQVDRSGSFQWTNVVPGNYVAEMHASDSSDAFLQAVIVAGARADTGFNLTGPTSVDLLVGVKGGSVEGVVLDGEKPAANATVVAVPEGKFRKLHERYGVGSTDQNGRFTIRGLPPGAYSVFAWQDVDDGLYYDAAFLQSQESNGASIKVEEEARRNVELKLSPVDEDWK